MMRTIIIFSFLFSFFSLVAQVTDVDYQLRFNASTSKYDCYLIVKQGSATSVLNRTQNSSQYSLVVPTGSTVDISDRYMPLIANQNYTGTIPCFWAINSIIFSPAAQPQNDFYSFTPNISPASHYNNLAPGDSVKLFSLLIEPIPVCKGEVRLFDFTVDPNSSSAGMEGSDFSQGFTLVSQPPIQMYPGIDYPNNAFPVVINDADAGFGSLRSAIECVSDGGTVHISNTLTSDTIRLQSKITINKNITINNFPTTKFNIKSMYNGQLFDISVGKNVVFNQLKLYAKFPNQNGQKRIIYNLGNLTLKNITLIDPNIGSGSGNTLYNKGTLTLWQSSFLRKTDI
jgi:hypothetical protein